MLRSARPCKAVPCRLAIWISVYDYLTVPFGHVFTKRRDTGNEALCQEFRFHHVINKTPPVALPPVVLNACR